MSGTRRRPGQIFESMVLPSRRQAPCSWIHWLGPTRISIIPTRSSATSREGTKGEEFSRFAPGLPPELTCLPPLREGHGFPEGQDPCTRTAASLDSAAAVFYRLSMNTEGLSLSCNTSCAVNVSLNRPSKLPEPYREASCRDLVMSPGSEGEESVARRCPGSVRQSPGRPRRLVGLRREVPEDHRKNRQATVLSDFVTKSRR